MTALERLKEKFHVTSCFEEAGELCFMLNNSFLIKIPIYRSFDLIPYIPNEAHLKEYRREQSIFYHLFSDNVELFTEILDKAMQDIANDN